MTTSESLAKTRAAKLGYRLEKAPTTDMRRTSYGTYRLAGLMAGRHSPGSASMALPSNLT